MEQLKYIVDDSKIVELLGMQNFSTVESAILELVKNAYDANAIRVSLIFHNDSLKIIDDGTGMNYDDILNHWMHIGKSEKDYMIIDKNNHKRIQAGSKGVGRFALSRLGHSVEIRSKTCSDEGVIWKTDWLNATVDVDPSIVKKGTDITIHSLREKWSQVRIKKLCEFLELTYKDTAMKIVVHYDGNEVVIPPHFDKPMPGVNCKSCIKMEYISGDLHVIVDSDEFQELAKDYCKDIDIEHYENKVNIADELAGSNLNLLVGDDLEKKTKELGDFSAVLFFNINSTQVEKDKFLYKYLKTPESIKGGVILYRNAFSISSYEGKKDWLGLGKRSRKSPAAASHPTGAWRVRENQIAGYIDIDKKRNHYLQDLANRQGLDENEYFELFISIIQIGLAEFERYRQHIIRLINTKNIEEEDVQTPLTDRILKEYEYAQKLSRDEARLLRDEIKASKQEEEKYKRQSEEREEKYKYDIRILNVLATTGLKASSIAHEMQNDQNTLDKWHEKTVKALKKYKMWDVLSSEEYTKYENRNVPSILERANSITSRISVFMNVMLEKMEKSQFNQKDQKVNSIMEKIVKTWERDYSWIHISVEMDDEIVFSVSEDMLKVIFDNLILNTVQQNSKSNSVSISIGINYNGDHLSIKYQDDGIGLHKKYKNDPMRILEVHETTRENGHGLGMWIVNNTCLMSGGQIESIRNEKGFCIEFSIGDIN